MSVECRSVIYRGYEIPYEAIDSLDEEKFVELDTKDLLHCLNGYKNSDYIFGYELSSVGTGEAKTFNPYHFEGCEWCHKDRDLLLMVIQYFSDYIKDFAPHIYFANVVC